MELNEQQYRAAFEIKGTTIVIASPGSGKTRTLVVRALYKLDFLPDFKSIALITYTNAAADEIASRVVTEKNVFIGTIHRFCLEYILRPFGWLQVWRKPKIITYDEILDFFKENRDIDLGYNRLDELNKIKKNISGQIDENIEWGHSVDLKTVAHRFYSYLQSINAIDFNEILYRSYYLVTNYTFISKSLANKFYEILIDEFQDTNIFQYEIFKSIKNSGSCSFFMVGDERQKIYRFAGAIDNASERAENDFNATPIELTKTYRSTDNIVKVYSSLFNNHPKINNQSDVKTLDIKVCKFETEKSNHNKTIANIVKRLIEKANIPLQEIAILSSRWFDAFGVSNVLRQKYDVVGLGALPHSIRNLNNSTFCLLRALSHYNKIPNVRSLRAIKRNIDLHCLENNISLADNQLNIITNKLITNLNQLNLSNNIEQGLIELKNIFDEIFKIEHSTIQDIINRIKDDEKPNWTMGKYLKTLSGVDGITSNTIHQAKGLEFDAVILNQMNEGKIPFQKWNGQSYDPLTNKSKIDGRNLFYVALSRAKKYLIILHNWKPSMFVNEIFI